VDAAASAPSQGKIFTWGFLRTSLSELIGAALLCFFGAAAISVSGNIDAEALKCTRIVFITLTDGLIYFALINLTMRLSEEDGAYLNPTVAFSLAFMDSIFVWRQFFSAFTRALILIVMQLFGAVAGTSLVLLAVPGVLNGSEKSGYSQPTFGTNVWAAFFVEALVGFFLVMMILAIRRNESRRSSIIAGFGYVAIRLLSYPLSGGFANPARSFGPAVVSITGMNYIWIYLLGSPFGALFAVPVFLYLHKEVNVDSDLQESGDAP